MSAPTRHTPGGPVSNGMLLALTDLERREAVAGLAPETRRALAHIALLGAARGVERSRKHRSSGREVFAERVLSRALELVELAALLTEERAS